METFQLFLYVITTIYATIIQCQTSKHNTQTFEIYILAKAFLIKILSNLKTFIDFIRYKCVCMCTWIELTHTSLLAASNKGQILAKYYTNYTQILLFVTLRFVSTKN